MGDMGARRPAAGSEDVAGAERRKGSDRAQPSFTTVRAAIDIDSEHPREEGLDRFGFGRRWRRRIERGPAGGQVLSAMAIGEEAIVSDPHEAVGEDMEEKPTDELLDG